MAGSEEDRFERVRVLAGHKGYTLQKHGEGSPVTKFSYSLIDKRTHMFVVERNESLDFIETWLNQVSEERFP
jgi:hypothetical protein